MEYMKEIFDFAAIKGLIQGSDGQKPLNVLMNAMNGGKEIFDFAAIKGLIHGSDGQKPLNVLMNAMNGGKEIFDFAAIRAHFHKQRFPPKSLPKLHALQSTVTIFMGL